MQAPQPPSQKQSVRDQFGPVAAHYASASVHRGGPDLEAMVPAAALLGHERVLDVGCGAGHTALAFAPHVRSVEALDLTEEMLEQVRRLAAERKAANVTTRLGDAESLPYAAASFDVVTCRLCAHHFRRPARAVSEMARVLAPDGRLLLVDIVSPEDPSLDTFLNAIEIVRDPSHVRDHSLAQWFSLMGSVGLAPALVATWAMRLDFSSWIARIGAEAHQQEALRGIFASANRDVSRAFDIDSQLAFTLQNAFILARAV